MKVKTVGLDLAKDVFQVHGISENGSVIFNKAIRRAKLLTFFETLSPCTVGMEACGSAHHWGRGRCQTDANQSLQGQRGCPLCRTKLTPLGESGGAVELENGAGVKVALQVEMVVNGSMNGGEFLQTSHTSKAQHRPFSSPKWLM